MDINLSIIFTFQQRFVRVNNTKYRNVCDYIAMHIVMRRLTLLLLDILLLSSSIIIILKVYGTQRTTIASPTNIFRYKLSRLRLITAGIKIVVTKVWTLINSNLPLLPSKQKKLKCTGESFRNEFCFPQWLNWIWN